MFQKSKVHKCEWCSVSKLNICLFVMNTFFFDDYSSSYLFFVAVGTWHPDTFQYWTYLSVQAYADYMGFILTLNDGVKGKKITCEYEVSEVCCLSYQRFLAAFYLMWGSGGRYLLSPMLMEGQVKFSSDNWRRYQRCHDSEAQFLPFFIHQCVTQDKTYNNDPSWWCCYRLVVCELGMFASVGSKAYSFRSWPGFVVATDMSFDVGTHAS